MKFYNNWIPAFAGMTIFLLLSACGCAPDKGDSEIGSDTMGYISGCWAHYKGQDK